MLYLTDIPESVLTTALKRAGIRGPHEIKEIITDFHEDTWWSDPKEFCRRIRAHGGDHVRFTDYLEEHGYKFQG